LFPLGVWFDPASSPFYFKHYPNAPRTLQLGAKPKSKTLRPGWGVKASRPGWIGTLFGA
jgi:hypothetical protein